MIKLFESTATDFSTLGLGVLNDAIKCIVTEERNGSFELEMEYPIDGIHYSEIKLRSIIVCKSNPFSNEQAFRVYYMSKPISGIVTIRAEHISYDLSGLVVSNFIAHTTSDALDGLKSNSTPKCNFEFETDKVVDATFEVKVPSTLRSLLGGVEGSILDVYGTGEYEFDNFRVSFKTNRGTNRGVAIRYGKNLTDLTQEENCTKVYTAVFPYWAGTMYEDDTSTDILVTLPEKTIDVEGTFNFSRVYPLDLGGKFTEQPTEKQLREAAQTYINQNGLGKPEVSLKVSFVQLEQAEEYEQLRLLESVYLCDTVNVIFDELGVNSTAKCIKTEYNAITDKYESLEFGSTRSNLANTIVDQADEIATISSPGFLDKEIDNATRLITGGLGGYVILHSSANQKKPDELLILDENSNGIISESKNVWRWNRNGLAFSNDGYNPNKFVTAITSDGRIVADFISAGTMKANHIKGGQLTLGGFNNESGILTVLGEGGNSWKFENLLNLSAVANDPYYINISTKDVGPNKSVGGTVPESNYVKDIPEGLIHSGIYIVLQAKCTVEELTYTGSTRPSVRLTSYFTKSGGSGNWEMNTPFSEYEIGKPIYVMQNLRVADNGDGSGVLNTLKSFQISMLNTSTQNIDITAKLKIEDVMVYFSNRQMLKLSETGSAWELDPIPYTPGYIYEGGKYIDFFSPKTSVKLNNEGINVFDGMIQGSRIGNGEITDTTTIDITAPSGIRLCFGSSAAWVNGCNLITRNQDHDNHDGFGTKRKNTNDGCFLHWKTVRKWEHDRNIFGWEVEFHEPSDIRLKNNIEEVPTSKIRKLFSRLQFKQFSFKDDPKARPRYGLIAQEVEEVLDDVGIYKEDTVYDRGDGYLKLEYGRIGRFCIPAIQDLYEQVEKLQNEVEKLKRGDQVE